MAQIKRFTFTNPNPAVAVNLDVGFTVSQILSIDKTGAAADAWQWVLGMDNASFLNADGSITATNGFTPLTEDSVYGATISAFTNAAPGVLTVNDTATFGFAAGDTVKVAEVADNLTGTGTLNGNFTVASVTATSITLVESTVGLAVYVSDGVVTRVSDTNGIPIPTENFSIRGITLGTGVVGTADAETVVIVHGENSVT